jgi:hypothetical protein
MSRRLHTSSTLTFVLGLYLFVEGVWGLVHPPAFGILSINPVRAILHLVFGAAAFYAIRQRETHVYLKAVGTIILFVGLGWFIPVFGDLIRSLLAIDRTGATVDIVAGLIALLAARTDKHADVRVPRDRDPVTY